MENPKALKDLKILIIDDVQSYRDELANLLKSVGIVNIVHTENGAEAWDKIVLESKGTEMFDLIISDINMPRMNGMELLKNVRGYKKTSKTPFVLVSTENEQSTILEAILLEILDYLIKPYDKDAATKKILKVLSKIAK
jgi:two-component system chemotaxis response regulator CheY